MNPIEAIGVIGGVCAVLIAALAFGEGVVWLVDWAKRRTNTNGHGRSQTYVPRSRIPNWVIQEIATADARGEQLHARVLDYAARWGVSATEIYQRVEMLRMRASGPRGMRRLGRFELAELGAKWRQRAMRRLHLAEFEVRRPEAGITQAWRKP